MCDADDSAPAFIHPAVPILLAALSAHVRGLTAFGDGITFQTLWAITTAVHLLPATSCYTMRKAVLYATIMQALTMPLQLWQARKQAKLIAPYVMSMLLVGGLGVWLGAFLLLTADVRSLRLVVGLLFLAFSSIRLTGSMYARLRARREAAVHAPTALHTEMVSLLQAPQANAEPVHALSAVRVAAVPPAGLTAETAAAGSPSPMSTPRVISVLAPSPRLFTHAVTSRTPTPSAKADDSASLCAHESHSDEGAQAAYVYVELDDKSAVATSSAHVPSSTGAPNNSGNCNEPAQTSSRVRTCACWRRLEESLPPWI
ncbi:hypothetical protein EON66_10850, partial [archaeon]